MDLSKSNRAAVARFHYWRCAIAATLAFGLLFVVVGQEPAAQSLRYHAFADTRKIFGIPNFFDVASNLPFLIIGIAGLKLALRTNLGVARFAWMVLFVGVGLVGIGSAYYHLAPTNQSLVWDRLPMTMGFMGLFIALLAEFVSGRFAMPLLAPAVVIGLLSVLYWHWSDDLRPYVLVQLAPLLTIPVVLVLFRSAFSHRWLLLVALGWYVLAKFSESYDLAIFRNTHEWLSGHSIKHLLAAAGCYSVLLMLQRRQATVDSRRHRR